MTLQIGKGQSQYVIFSDIAILKGKISLEPGVRVRFRTFKTGGAAYSCPEANVIVSCVGAALIVAAIFAGIVCAFSALGITDSRTRAHKRNMMISFY